MHQFLGCVPISPDVFENYAEVTSQNLKLDEKHLQSDLIYIYPYLYKFTFMCMYYLWVFLAEINVFVF